MDNSFIPEELRWTEADQAKFGTPSAESIKQTEREIEDHYTTKPSKITQWTINGVDATESEFNRAKLQMAMLDESLAAHFAHFFATRNKNLVDIDVVSFRILENHELPDGFWGRIDLLTFRDATQAYRVNINIAPPDSEENYGTISSKTYASIEDARATLIDELREARARGLKSTQEGGVVGQPIFPNWR